MTSLAQYERARVALAEIKTLPDAVTFVRGMEHLRLHAKQVQDRALMAEAAEIQFKAEIKLGELLGEAKTEGRLRDGRPKKNDTNPESFSLKDLKLTPRQSSQAQHKASISERAQLFMIERMRDRILSGGATIIDQVTSTAEKKERRATREKVLAGIQCALPTRKFGLIYCDIPRHFNVRSDETGMDRAPENHYRTMTFDDLLNLPIPDIAADDSILVFWSTAASLFDDIEIMAEWGFAALRPRDEFGKLCKENGCALPPIGEGSYRSMQVWDKINIGMGYWFRDRHEFTMIGVRGNAVPPARGTQDESLFSEKKGKHSAKPNRVAEMLQRLWPNTPTIELFARDRRPWTNWTIWGNEAPSEIIAPSNRKTSLTPAKSASLPELANAFDHYEHQTSIP